MNLEISPTYLGMDQYLLIPFLILMFTRGTRFWHTAIFWNVSKNDSLVSKNRRGNLSFRDVRRTGSSPHDLQDEGASLVRTAPQTAAVSEAEHGTGWPNQKLLMFEMLKDIFVRFCEFLRDMKLYLWTAFHFFDTAWDLVADLLVWLQDEKEASRLKQAMRCTSTGLMGPCGAYWLNPLWGCRQPTGLLQGVWVQCTLQPWGFINSRLPTYCPQLTAPMSAVGYYSPHTRSNGLNKTCIRLPTYNPRLPAASL